MALTKVDTSMVESSGAFGRRNILINGDFSVYQRAQQVTGLGAATEYYTADRWKIQGASGISGRFTMTAGTADAPAESNVTTSLKLDCTTADTSLAAGEYLILQQLIEGQNLQHVKKGTSGAKQLTASFWIKGNASATYIAELYDADNTRQVSKSFSVTSSWSKVEITFPADTTGAFGNDANVSLYCQIWLAAGSDFTSGTLSETWTSATNTNRAVGVSNFYSSTSNELYITAWQLEVGDVATEFEVLSYPERLTLCHRYCFAACSAGEAGASASQVQIGIGSFFTDTQVETVVYFPTTMRSSPTLSANSGTDYFISEANAGGQNFDSWTGVYGAGKNQKLIYSSGTISNFSNQGQATRLAVQNSAAYIIFESEL